MRYRYGSIPHRTSSAFVGCADCGVLVWDKDIHERTAHPNDPAPPEQQYESIVPLEDLGGTDER